MEFVMNLSGKLLSLIAIFALLAACGSEPDDPMTVFRQCAELARAGDLDAWERTRDYPLIGGGALAHENPVWVAAADRRELVLQPDVERQTPRSMAIG